MSKAPRRLKRPALREQREKRMRTALARDSPTSSRELLDTVVRGGPARRVFTEPCQAECGVDSSSAQLERAETMGVAGWCQSNTGVDAQSRTAEAEHTRERSTDACAAQ